MKKKEEDDDNDGDGYSSKNVQQASIKNSFDKRRKRDMMMGFLKYILNDDAGISSD